MVIFDNDDDDNHHGDGRDAFEEKVAKDDDGDPDFVGDADKAIIIIIIITITVMIVIHRDFAGDADKATRDGSREMRPVLAKRAQCTLPVSVFLCVF